MLIFISSSTIISINTLSSISLVFFNSIATALLSFRIKSVHLSFN